MINFKDTNGRKQVSIVSIDDLVPKDHLLRKIEKAVDWKFIYEEVKDKYSEDNGRPSKRNLRVKSAVSFLYRVA